MHKVSGSHQLDYEDGRTLALMIAHTYPCGWIEASSIGVTWRPRSAKGRHWTERKCHTVLDGLVDFGLVTLYESITGLVARVNESGYRFFDLGGKPAISDTRAERQFFRGVLPAAADRR